jgi:ribosomal protein L29
VKAPGVSDELKKLVDDFDKELAQLKPQLGVGQTGFDPGAFQRNVRQRVAGLKGSVMGSTSRPTETQMRQLGESRDAMARLVGEVNAAIARAQRVSQALAAANLLMEVPKPLAVPIAAAPGGR